jgi:competence protein ComEC
MAASTALAIVLDDESLDSPLGLVRAVLTTNIAAQIATLPFAVGAFGQVPLLALPANLLVAPLAQVAFVLAAGAGIAGAVGEVISGFTQVGELLAACAAVPAGLVLTVVDNIGGFDGATITLRAGTFGVGALAVGCAVVLCLLSPDAQRWLARTMRDTAGHRLRAAALLASGIGVSAVVLAIATIR